MVTTSFKMLAASASMHALTGVLPGTNVIKRNDSNHINKSLGIGNYINQTKN